jgi:hypothetical protein
MKSGAALIIKRKACYNSHYVQSYQEIYLYSTVQYRHTANVQQHGAILDAI